MRMTDEFIEPTPQGRRNLVALWVIGVVIVFSYRLWLGAALLGYIHSLPLCDQLPWWRGLLVSVWALFFLVALLCTWNAIKLLRQGQFPLRGTWVFQRIKIQRGVAVRRRAYLLFSASALAVFLAWYCWESLSNTPIFHPIGKCASHRAFSLPETGSARGKEANE